MCKSERVAVPNVTKHDGESKHPEQANSRHAWCVDMRPNYNYVWSWAKLLIGEGDLRLIHVVGLCAGAVEPMPHIAADGVESRLTGDFRHMPCEKLKSDLGDGAQHFGTERHLKSGRLRKGRGLVRAGHREIVHSVKIGDVMAP